MFVSELLKTKKAHVHTTRPYTHVSEAISLFKEKKIGALLVCETSGGILGILSERDVLHELAAHGAETLNYRVDEVMSRKVHTCTPDDDLKHVMRLMTSKFVRHVPVVVKGELLGMISSGDILKYRLDETQLEVDTLRDFARIH